MGAPEFVPVPPRTSVRSYASPPRRPRSWMANRPGELSGVQPHGDRLGTPGPDQGYALALAAGFVPRMKLSEHEHVDDAVAGAAAVAMKRAGLHGRAPMPEDVEAALIVWGLLGSGADPALVELRRRWFAEIHSPHQYERRRRVADAVPADVLCQSVDDIGVAHAEDWRQLLDLDL